MPDVTNIVVCPSCGARNIEGADTCENCMMDLRTVDVPETAQAVSDSMFLDPLVAIRVTRAASVRKGATVREALDVLRHQPTGAIIVVDEGQEPVGIFTERDVLKRVAGVPGVLDLPVDDVMTPDPVLLRESDTVNAALNKMGSTGFRHIPLTQDGAIISMVTARDMLSWIMSRYFD